MNDKTKSIWDADSDAFMPLEERLKKIYDSGVEDIYLYPYGQKGMYIHDYLMKKFSFKKIVCVDKNLKNYNKNIINLEDLKRELDNADYKKIKVILASDNPWIFTELRLEISDYVPAEIVMDIYSINLFDYGKDRRIAALAQASRQIYRNNVQGSVAEVGVYQGEFAKYINALFPRRTLFLFDTFAGFEENMVVNEDDRMQTDSWINLLKDTSIDVVLSKLPYKKQVIVRKGIFPNTAEGIEEKFSFVNLDTDLYESIYSGLNFFWKRLNAGGYIFVHDFEHWNGVTNAVTQFCKENKIGYVVFPECVTACLAKPL